MLLLCFKKRKIEVLKKKFPQDQFRIPISIDRLQIRREDRNGRSYTIHCLLAFYMYPVIALYLVNTIVYWLSADWVESLSSDAELAVYETR
jgi:hypothetical protein